MSGAETISYMNTCCIPPLMTRATGYIGRIGLQWALRLRAVNWLFTQWEAVSIMPYGANGAANLS